MTPSIASCGSEWRWRGKAAELRRRRIVGGILGLDLAFLRAMTFKSGRWGQQELDEELRVAADAVVRVGRALLERQRRRVGQAVHATRCDELLVDSAETSLERRPHGRAERDGLAIHRAARADDEVGKGDQGRGVDRVLAARSRSTTGRRTSTCGLLVRSTQTRIE